MDTSDFELIVLYGVYVGILWLTFRSEPETPFLSILHHSTTPTLLEGSLPEEPNSSAVALKTKVFLIMKCQTPTASAPAQACPPAGKSEAVGLDNTG